MTLSEQLEARLPRTASDNSRHSIRSAFMIEAGYRQKSDAIRADGRLSAEGKADELSKLKSATLSNGHLCQIRDIAKNQLAGITAEKEAFKAAVLKRPTDSLTEQRNAEIRSMLRGMSEPERIKLAMSGDAEIADAVMLANPALSGIPALLHDQLVERVVSTRHQVRGDDLTATQDEAEAVLAAVTVASDMISRA